MFGGSVCSLPTSNRICMPCTSMDTISPGEPIPRNFPSTSTATRSHNISASERMCVEKKIVRPCRFKSRIISRTSRRPPGQAHQAEKTGHAFLPLRRVEAEKAREISQQFPRRQVIVKIGLLRHVPDLAMHAHIID